MSELASGHQGLTHHNQQHTIKANIGTYHEVMEMRLKLEQQQKLLESERKVTDEVISSKNRTIEALQNRLEALTSEKDREIAELKSHGTLETRELVKSFEKELEVKDHLLSLKSMELEEKIAEMKIHLNELRNEDQLKHAQTLQECREAHRKEVKRIQSQNDANIEALKVAHSADVASIREESRRLLESAQRKQALAEKSVRKEIVEEIDKLKRELVEKESKLSQLRETVLSQSRATDKKRDGVIREYEKKLIAAESLMHIKVEETKQSYNELVKRLEQRCLKLENDKNSLRDGKEAELKRMHQDHKRQTDKIVEDKNKELEELRKEWRSRMKSLQDDFQKSTELQSISHQEQIRTLETDLNNKLKLKVRNFELVILQLQEKIRDQERQLEKLQMKLSIKESLWLKKERETFEEANQQVAQMQEMTKSLHEANNTEVTRLQELLRQKDVQVQQQAQICTNLQAEILSLKRDVEISSMNAQKNDFEKVQRIKQLERLVENMQSGEDNLFKRIRDLEKDLNGHLNTIDSLRSHIKILENELEIRRNRSRSPRRLSPIKKQESPNKQQNDESFVIDLPSEDNIESNQVQYDDGNDAEPEIDLTFENVKRDIQQAIQGHIDRIESLTDELQTTKPK